MAYRADNLDEALFTSLLAYKMATSMKNKEEMGVMELSIARMLNVIERTQKQNARNEA